MLGQSLLFIKDYLKFTYRSFAKETGFSTTFLKQIIDNRCALPTDETIKRISNALSKRFKEVYPNEKSIPNFELQLKKEKEYHAAIKPVVLLVIRKTIDILSDLPDDSNYKKSFFKWISEKFLYEHEIDEYDYETFFNKLNELSIDIKFHLFWHLVGNVVFDECDVTINFYDNLLKKKYDENYKVEPGVDVCDLPF